MRAQHLDRAEDERAAGAYLAAALSQRAVFRVEAALRSAERGLQIARTEADRHELMCLIGDLQRDMGEIGASVASYRAAVAAASDARMRCRAELGLAEGLRVNEGLDEALTLLDARASRPPKREQLVADLARLHHLRGNIYFPMGNIEGCRIEHERGLNYAKRSGSAEAEARALGGLADAAYAQGKMRTAFDYFSRCVDLCQQHGFGRIEVANRSMVGFSRAYLNELLQAREDGDAAARVAAMVGQPRAELLGETMGVLSSLRAGGLRGDAGVFDAFVAPGPAIGREALRSASLGATSAHDARSLASGPKPRRCCGKLWRCATTPGPNFAVRRWRAR